MNAVKIETFDVQQLQSYLDEHIKGFQEAYKYRHFLSINYSAARHNINAIRFYREKLQEQQLVEDNRQAWLNIRNYFCPMTQAEVEREIAIEENRAGGETTARLMKIYLKREF